MNILSKSIMCLTISILSQSVEAISIKDFEENVLRSECFIDPDNPNKMVCNEYCEVFSAASGAKLGSKNKFWNCDEQSGSSLNAWKSNWNLLNPDKQVNSCAPDGSDYHKAWCDLDIQELVGTNYGPIGILLLAEEWNDCVLDGTLCPEVQAFITFNGNNFRVFHTHEVSGSGIGSGSPALELYDSGLIPWVSSPTGADVSGEYDITPLPVTSASLSTVFGNYGDFPLELGFRACEKADPSNCQNYNIIYLVAVEP